jgi:hypothetical protein
LKLSRELAEEEKARQERDPKEEVRSLLHKAINPGPVGHTELKIRLLT